MLKQVTLALAFVVLAAAAPQFPFYHNPYAIYNPYMTMPVLRSPYQPTFMPYPLSYASHIAAPVPVQQPVPVQHPVPFTRTGAAVHNQQEVQKPFVQPEDNSISLELAEKLLTPEQLRLLEETVAAMNPLEYAARLEATKDPEEAIRLFKKSRY